MLALRTRPKGARSASFGLSAFCVALAPTSLGYQDLAALIARQPAVSERWREHLIASPFGTIHAATFSFPRPLGTAMPEPPGFQRVNFDPGSIDVSRNEPQEPLVGAGAQPIVFPVVNRRLKGDRLPMPMPKTQEQKPPEQALPQLQPIDSEPQPATPPVQTEPVTGPPPGVHLKQAEQFDPRTSHPPAPEPELVASTVLDPAAPPGATRRSRSRSRIRRSGARRCSQASPTWTSSVDPGRGADDDRGRPGRSTCARVVAIAEFEALARVAMDPAAYDYIAGGAWDEQSLAEAEAAWRRRRLRPRVLVDVSHVDPSTTMAGSARPAPGRDRADGGPRPRPSGCGAGDGAGRGCGRASRSRSRRCRASRSRTSRPRRLSGIRWFQLYTQADPRRSREFVERAEAAGYRAIIVTVDLPVLGYRERDLRSGFDLSVPHGNFPDDAGPDHAGHSDKRDGGYDILQAGIDRGLTWADLAAIRSWTEPADPAEGHPDRRGRPPGRRARRGRDRGLEPRCPPARPDRRPGRRPRGDRRQRSADGRRSGSTAACGAASTWSPRSPSAPAASSSAGRSCGRSRPRARRASSGPSRSSATRRSSR